MEILLSQIEVLAKSCSDPLPLSIPFLGVCTNLDLDRLKLCYLKDLESAFVS